VSAADLLALAERCEQATGPDRELDCAIAHALGWKQYEFADENDYVERGWHKPESRFPVGSLPRWTASLDAALTLVPHPAWIRMDEWPSDFCHGPVASIQPIRDPQVGLHVATGSSLALALVAAALRARAAQESGK
jgi:hypothetical protein